jgi:hypothetical protein
VCLRVGGWVGGWGLGMIRYRSLPAPIFVYLSLAPSSTTVDEIVDQLVIVNAKRTIEHRKL